MTRGAALRELLADTARGLRGHDLALQAAGVTFYGGIALIPSLLVAIKLLSLVAGPDRIERLAGTLAEALPEALGAPKAARDLLGAGVGLSPVTAVVAVVPATLYGEGLRRSFVSLTGSRDALTGWRGRLRVLPLFAVAPLLVNAVLLITPTLASLLNGGSLGGGALGVYLSLNVDWLVLWCVVGYSYAVVGPNSPGWRALLWGAGSTAAVLSGFVQGFVLFLAIPVDLGAPFGGLTAIGAVVAVCFWLWMLHLLVLVGYVLTWRLDARGGSPWTVSPREADRG